MGDFFSGIIGGIIGAAAAVDVPAEGERHPRAAAGTDWGVCTAKLGDTIKEIETVINSVSFIAGKLANCLRIGIEHLSKCILSPSSSSSSFLSSSSSCPCLLDKNDINEGIEAGRQGTECLLRGGKLFIEVLIDASKIAATRCLLLAASSKDIIIRQLPYTQDKLYKTYSSFLRGYQSSAAARLGGAAAAPYSAAAQQQPSYGAPPASQQPSGGFFW
uniref:SO7 protein n=1 Tax=Eimeria maxima TaxID=5804 RepID=A0AA50LSI3_EIMMA|nr:SO7 protein [Eimeria maxima]